MAVIAAMPRIPFILADGSIAILVIVILVWVVGAILAQSKKHPQQKKRSWDQILRDLAGGPTSTGPTMPPVPPRTEPTEQPRPAPTAQHPRPAPTAQHPVRPAPKPQAMRPPLPQRRPVIKKLPVKKKPVAQPQPAAPVRASLSEALSTASAATQVTTSVGAAATAAAAAVAVPAPSGATAPHDRPGATGKARAIHRWLSPQTLRGQFILTEVLRPPLGLREEP